MRRLVPRLLALAVAGAALGTVVPACSLGEGKGGVTGELNIPDCWQGPFDLKPDFFAAIPYRQTALIIRIQNGGDYETFSDGVTILVDDIGLVRGTGPADTLIGKQLAVSLPPSVVPPGVPVKAVPDPARVHFALYLQRSCHIQNTALYAVDAVTLRPSGACVDSLAVDSGVVTDANPVSAAAQCGALGLATGDGGGAGGDASADASLSDAATPSPMPSPPPASAPIGTSWIRFNNLFDGNPDESDANNRLNDGEFEVYLADPRDICPGAFGPPPPCRAHLKGTFRFYFQRGRPAQPFP